MPHTHTEGVVTATANATDVELVAQELARQLIHPHLGFVLFFCSAEYDLQSLGEALDQYFGGINLVGCTSAGGSPPRAMTVVASAPSASTTAAFRLPAR